MDQGDLQAYTADELMQDHLKAQHRILVQPAKQKLEAAVAAAVTAHTAARVKFQAAADACKVELTETDLELLAGGAVQPQLGSEAAAGVGSAAAAREASLRESSAASIIFNQLMNAAIRKVNSGDLDPLHKLQAAQEEVTAATAVNAARYAALRKVKVAKAQLLRVADAVAALREAHRQRRRCKLELDRSDMAYLAATENFPDAQAAAGGGAEGGLAAAGVGADGGSSAAAAKQAVEKYNCRLLLEMDAIKHMEACEKCDRLYDRLQQVCAEVGVPMPAELGVGVPS
jgi:hypothetical protein